MWLSGALCKHFLSVSVHCLVLFSWTTWTLSSWKYLMLSHSSIFVLSCYLITWGFTAVFPHRAVFLLLLHRLTKSCLFWLPNSHCFAVTVCSNSHSKLNCFWVLLIVLWSIVWVQSHDSQTLRRALRYPILSPYLSVPQTASFLFGNGVNHWHS